MLLIVKEIKCSNCAFVGENINHEKKHLICNKRVLGPVEPDFYCGDFKPADEVKDHASKES